MGDDEKLWRRMRRLGVLTVVGLLVPLMLPVAAAISVPSLAWMTLTLPVDRRRARSWLMAATIAAGIVSALSATALIVTSPGSHADVVLPVALVGVLVGFGCYARGMQLWCSDLGWTSAAKSWDRGSWCMGAAALAQGTLAVGALAPGASESRDGSRILNSSWTATGVWNGVVLLGMAVLVIVALRQMWRASRSFVVAWNETGRSPLRPDETTDTTVVRSV